MATARVLLGSRRIEGTALHFVGSLPPSDFPELLAVPASRFRPVGDPYPGVTAFETRVVALGAERRVVVTHSPTLHAKQAAGFTQTLTKAGQRLTELAQRLARGKTPRGPAAVEAEIAQIVSPRWVSPVIPIAAFGRNQTSADRFGCLLSRERPKPASGRAPPDVRTRCSRVLARFKCSARSCLAVFHDRIVAGQQG